MYTIYDMNKKTKSDNGQEALKRAIAMNLLVQRRQLAQKMGTSYEGRRDLYESLGYPRTLRFEDYWGRYKRQDIAARVIGAPVMHSWRLRPRVKETTKAKRETPFEKTWKELVKKHDIYSKFIRGDILSRIGEYSVLLLGVNDSSNLASPIRRADKLLYVQPYKQDDVEIIEVEHNIKDERYNKPKLYLINMFDEKTKTVFETHVHHSRIIHIVDGILESEIYGTPELENIWNRLQDIETIAGASAEAFWRNSFPGVSFEMDAGAAFSAQDEEDVEDQIEKYIHDAQRYLTLKGIKANQLLPSVTSPRETLSAHIDLVASAKRIPKRILMGSERGELASSQDENEWNKMGDERRKNHNEYQILRPFIDRLIQIGIFPEPKNSYEVSWPDMVIPTDKEKAEIGRVKAQTLRLYKDSEGESVVPNDIFLRDFLGFTEEEILKEFNASQAEK